jgi:hypothetical protein
MQCSKQRTYAMSVRVSTICGRRIVKVEPRPGLLSTVMSPPIMWAAGRRAAEATAESKQPQGLAGNHLHNVFEGISRPALPMPAISRHPPVARWTVKESDHRHRCYPRFAGVLRVFSPSVNASVNNFGRKKAPPGQAAGQFRGCGRGRYRLILLPMMRPTTLPAVGIRAQPCIRPSLSPSTSSLRLPLLRPAWPKQRRQGDEPTRPLALKFNGHTLRA